MTKKVVLITGANGEIGHGLINSLCGEKDTEIVALDLNPLDESLLPSCADFIQGDILDPQVIDHLKKEHCFNTVYHLASLLSTSAEKNPELAHKVNVDGTMNLFQMALEHGKQIKTPVKFLYPSSIAAYGIENLDQKKQAGAITEDQFLAPTTMYGCNKLYCENLGRYYMSHYRQLTQDTSSISLDFRGLRFPGLISADTLPTGGTTDFGPEMLHHAAQNKPYACFVRPDTRLPFMAMPDAIKSLLNLENAPRQALTKIVYNVTSFSPTAEEIYQIVLTAFPNSEITFKLDSKRQGIVDSWPEDINDSAARHDWGWSPDYDQARAFNEYLIPAIRSRYQ